MLRHRFLRAVHFLFVVRLVLPWTGGAEAATLDVPGDHTTIQAALDAASAGDTVLVATGTYFENDLTFGGKDLVLQSASGPEVTIIDGSGAAPVFRLDAGLSRAAVVEGFTVQNGFSDSFAGAGIDVLGGQPKIRGNIIIDNQSTGGGAGIKVRGGANPLIQSNRMESNAADSDGGGIQVIASSAEILDNWIEGNTAIATSTSTGGGINLSAVSGTPLVSGNTLRLNSSTFAGGGISVLGSNVEMDNNTIEENTSEFGGGVHFETNAGVVSWLVTRNRVLHNTATRNGGGLNFFSADVAATAEVYDNAILGNEAHNPLCTTGSESDCGQGGGLRTSQGTGVQTFQGNTISGNRADRHGGALLLGLPAQGKTVHFIANRVEANTTRFEFPGVTCRGVTTCELVKNSFLANAVETAPAGGANPGALFLRNVGTATVENNYFRGNEGRLAGAILASSSGPAMTVVIRNNTFADNSTLSTPDGTLRILVDATVVNNLFVGDTRALSVRDSPSISIENNDFFGFSVGVYKDETVSHATVAALNGESFASANVELAPGFLNPDYVYLEAGSLLIGTGSCSDAPAEDIDGEARPVGPGCEIGADEHDPATLEIFSDGFESGTSEWSSSI